MSEFSSFGGTSEKTAKVAEELKKQIAMQNAQQILQKMSNKCFEKCIHYPNQQLDSKEQKCLASCADRFMETWNTVSQTYTSRVQKGQASSGY